LSGSRAKKTEAADGRKKGEKCSAYFLSPEKAGSAHEKDGLSELEKEEEKVVILSSDWKTVGLFLYGLEVKDVSTCRKRREGGTSNLKKTRSILFNSIVGRRDL